MSYYLPNKKALQQHINNLKKHTDKAKSKNISTTGRQYELNLNNSLRCQITVPIGHILSRMLEFYKLGVEAGRQCVESSDTSGNILEDCLILSLVDLSNQKIGAKMLQDILQETTSETQSMIKDQSERQSSSKEPILTIDSKDSAPPA